MRMFATCKVVHSTLCENYELVFLKDNIFFWRRQFLSFDGIFVRIKGQKALYSSVWEFLKFLFTLL